MQEYFAKVAQMLSIRPDQVRAVEKLLSEDATVPFIARYRKEATDSLDEVAITGIRDELARLRALDDRREAILASLEKHGHLTDELKAEVMAAETMARLEDIYLPYKPKRRTRGMIAREKGLEPLADILWEQNGADPLAEAGAYVNPEAGVENVEDALAGARDILAERVNEDADARAELREFFEKNARFHCMVIPGREEAGAKFRDYFDWEEPAIGAPSHRVLAMRRGEREEVLDLAVTVPEEEALTLLEARFVTGAGADSGQVREAVRDAFKRLLFRSMETEIRLASKEVADDEAVRVFAENLKHLLLAPPLGQKRVLAIDPGQRTGCKVVCLSAQGALLHHDVIYLHSSARAREDAAQNLTALCKKFEIEAVAVGSGTAGRETEAFVRALSLPGDPPVIMVDESGASVYSASDTARLEFPDQDVTVRGSVSIGRRLMDPLAELVKIDPKSIGVGQYQHDVDQLMLRGALDDVVVSAVNAVGVDVNTASRELLRYVSGLGPALSENIVAHRKERGPFNNRKELLEVPRLGPKAFEQAAGFLRIQGGGHPLDASAVHPESYEIVERMAADLGATVEGLMNSAELRARIDLNQYVTEERGLPTLTDILAELEKPGRDPREKLDLFTFDENVHEITDLTPGMWLPGVVKNVTRFGAFVDVGVHTDGLVHISEMADRFVKDPAEVVHVHQKVRVRVLEVDVERKRIGLSMKATSQARPEKTAKPAEKKRAARPGPAKSFKKEKSAEKQPFHNPFADLAKLKGGGKSK